MPPELNTSYPMPDVFDGLLKPDVTFSGGELEGDFTLRGYWLIERSSENFALLAS